MSGFDLSKGGVAQLPLSIVSRDGPYNNTSNESANYTIGATTQEIFVEIDASIYTYETEDDVLRQGEHDFDFQVDISP